MKEASRRPHLSIVVAARNDNYGGDFVARLRIFADGLASHNRRHPGLFELVVVEWNPPADREPLSGLFDWAAAGAVRIITVPNTLHMAVPAERRPAMFEYRAKNVGLRRASGSFVLVTNPDILFSDELFDLVASRALRTDAFYRADRHDYVPSEDSSWPGRVIRINRRHHSSGALINPEGDFGEDTARWPKSEAMDGDRVLDEERMIECFSTDGPLWGRYTNGAGDFILASRPAWRAAGGFWERTDTVAGLDGAMVFQFWAQSFRQVVLLRPYMIFHHEHDRSEHQALPKLPRPEISAMHEAIMRGQETTPFEQRDWGMANVDLPEQVIGSRNFVS